MKNPSPRRRSVIIMSGFILALLIFFLLLPTPEQDITARQHEPASEAFVIQGARIFDGESLIEDHHVVVRGGHIEAVRPDQEGLPDLPIVDGENGTLLPGLIDAHVHVFGDGRREALRFGVTSLIDLFSDHRPLPAARAERRDTAPTDAADLWSAGTLVTAPGGHGTQFGLDIPTLDHAEQADAFIAERLAEGADFIKLVYESGEGHGFQVNRLDADAMTAAIAAAQARGVLVVAHAGNREEARAVLEAGADGLAHIFADAPVDEELLALMRAESRFVIPTLTVTASVLGEAVASELLADEAFAQRLTLNQRGGLKAGFPELDGPGRYAHAEDNVRRMAEAGIPILAGSDAPNPGTAQGASLHEELARLVAAGLSPAQALRAATVVPARVFELPQRGGITPGYRADLLLVAGNPLEDIDDTRRIQAVWKNGQRLALNDDDNDKAPPPPDSDNLVLSNFDEDLSARFGQDWAASSDEHMGGSSVAHLRHQSEGELAWLAVEGEIRRGFPFPYAGTIWFPGQTPMAPVDLSDYDGIELRLRADVARLRLMAFSSANPGGRPAEKAIEMGDDWQTVRIEFSALAGLDPDSITGLGLFAGPDIGPFRFELDRVWLWRQADE